jgi:hypothetical protein
MSKAIDLTGQTFGRWTVIERVKNNNCRKAMWLCECGCEQHTRKEVLGYTLRKGKSKSCGCLQKEKVSKLNFIDISGKKFGHLTVLEFAGKDNSKKILWKCKCDCEAETIIIVRGADLKSGKTTSCGCVKSKGEEKIAKILKDNNILFKKEKTFSTCRFKDTDALARFDFYLPDQNIVIEYDGEQHFNKNNPWYGKNKEHDDFKNDWCKKNNILIIRISYTQLEKLTIKDLIL